MRNQIFTKSIMPRCSYCQSHNFPNISALHRHQGQAKNCLKLRHLYRQQLIAEQRAQKLVDVPAESNLGLGAHPSPNPDVVYSPSPEPEAQPMEIEELEDNNMDTTDQDARRPRVEEVQDEDDCGVEYVETFPEEAYAGASHGHARTLFESIRDEQVLRGAEILGPFESDAEWQLAKWLIKNVGHNQAEEFLKLPVVCDNCIVVSSGSNFEHLHFCCSKIQDRVDPSFANKDMLMDTVDELPRGVKWVYRPINLNGDILDDNGKPMTEHLELWYRDPVEVVRELMGNPIFKEVMRYAPERVYCDSVGAERVVNEMWTAEWWWEVQVS
jgi:hypothetical protein